MELDLPVVLEGPSFAWPAVEVDSDRQHPLATLISLWAVSPAVDVALVLLWDLVGVHFGFLSLVVVSSITTTRNKKQQHATIYL